MADTRLTFYHDYKADSPEKALALAQEALDDIAPAFSDIHDESISLSSEFPDTEDDEPVWTARAYREGIV